MLDGFIWIVRVIQAVFAIIVLGLGAYVANSLNHLDYGYYGYYDYYVGSPGQVNFIIFDAVWTLLVVLYLLLAPRFSDKLGHKFIILALDAFTTLLWFAGFIALAVAVGIVDSPYSYYHSAQACVAFAAFTWALFLFCLVLDLINIFRGNTGTRSHHAGGANNIQTGV